MTSQLSHARLREQAARANRRVAKSNRKWSRALGLHESQGSKQRTGDPTQRDATYDFYVRLHELAITPDCNPMHLLEDGNQIVQSVLMTGRTRESLERDLDREIGRAAKAEANIRRLTYRGDMLALSDAYRDSAGHHGYISALLRQLAAHAEDERGAAA